MACLIVSRPKTRLHRPLLNQTIAKISKATVKWRLFEPAYNRIGLWDNILFNVYCELAVVASTVLAIPVTSCAAERNLTIWGQVYVKTRSNLGLQRAQDVIYVKAKDTIANTRPQTEDDLVIVLDNMTLS